MRKFFSGYFEPSEIKDKSIPNGSVKVTVYFNGLYYTCPGDKQRCESIEQQYQNGMYISKDVCTISKETYCMLRYGCPTKPPNVGYDSFLDEIKPNATASSYAISKPSASASSSVSFDQIKSTKLVDLMIQKYGDSLTFRTYFEKPEIVGESYLSSGWNDYVLKTLYQKN